MHDLIFPLEELDWINEIMIQDEKIGEGEIHVSINFKGLIVVGIHAILPTPFGSYLSFSLNEYSNSRKDNKILKTLIFKIYMQMYWH